MVTPVGYWPVSSSACTRSPVLVVVAAIDCTLTSWLDRGLPRQFIVMWENSRCSTLFHLEVPGGKWHTVICSPVSAARVASSTFLQIDARAPARRGRGGRRHRHRAGVARPDRPTDRRLHRTRSRLRPRRDPRHRPPDAHRRRAVQQLRLRRRQRHDRVRPARAAPHATRPATRRRGRHHRCRRGPSGGGHPARPLAILCGWWIRCGRCRAWTGPAWVAGVPGGPGPHRRRVAPAGPAARPARPVRRRRLPAGARRRGPARRRPRRRPRRSGRRYRHRPGRQPGTVQPAGARTRPRRGQPGRVSQNRLQRRGWPGGDAAGNPRPHLDRDRGPRGGRGSRVRGRRPAARRPRRRAAACGCRRPVPAGAAGLRRTPGAAAPGRARVPAGRGRRRARPGTPPRRPRARRTHPGRAHRSRHRLRRGRDRPVGSRRGRHRTRHAHRAGCGPARPGRPGGDLGQHHRPAGGRPPRTRRHRPTARHRRCPDPAADAGPGRSGRGGRAGVRRAGPAPVGHRRSGRAGAGQQLLARRHPHQPDPVPGPGGDQMTFPVTIPATGAHLPGAPITNAHLEKLCGPLPADVLDGLGITRRHWLVDPATGEHTTSNSRMATAAARTALHRAGLTPGDVDLIVLSTASPEYHLPSSASYVQEHLGLPRCSLIELRAGCVGAIQALDIARRHLADGSHRTALVIGTEAISPLLVPMYHGLDPHQVRMRDRLCLYNFGDGAAAAVLRAGPERVDGDPPATYAYVTACLGADRKPGMQVIGGGTDIPYAKQLRRKRLIDIRLDAAGVAAHGPHVFVTALQDLLHRAGLGLPDVDVCVLPEGNAGYFSAELEAAGMSRTDHDRIQNTIVENLTDVGATGSPAVLLALDAGVGTGRIRPHDTVLLVAIEASRYLYAMKTTTRRAAVLVAAGALGLGGLAVAAPAVAGMGPFGQPTVAASDPGPGWRGGNGMGPGNGMGMGSGNGMRAGMGTNARDGSCAGLAVTAATGTLTEQQRTTLAAMAQEEKLAHDLYTAFADRYPAVVFDRIAASETRHLTAVRTLLARYGLADPTAGKPAGQFSDPAVPGSYDKLLAQGQANQAAALKVGETVEQTDIADLQAALNGLTAPDVRQVYTTLLTASRHHLTALQNWSAR